MWAELPLVFLTIGFQFRSEDKVNGVIDAEPKLYLKNNTKSVSAYSWLTSSNHND